MKPEEQLVSNHLKNLFGENVVFEPEPNRTPDFEVNSSIGVEVRRLNQYFIKGEQPEGLEQISFPLIDAFRKTAETLNYLYTGISYWVYIEYKRPLSTNIYRVKKDMELALKSFLNSHVSNFPYEVSVNPEIIFSFYESNLGNGKLFPIIGSFDSDAGGGNISVYVESIRHCIDEKSLKISNSLQKYTEWWLYLVDYIELGLDSNEVKKVVKMIDNLRNFDKVVILSFDGKNILATISRDPHDKL